MGNSERLKKDKKMMSEKISLVYNYLNFQLDEAKRLFGIAYNLRTCTSAAGRNRKMERGKFTGGSRWGGEA
jgi:hypothetical protein